MVLNPLPPRFRATQEVVVEPTLFAPKDWPSLGGRPARCPSVWSTSGNVQDPGSWLEASCR